MAKALGNPKILSLNRVERRAHMRALSERRWYHPEKYSRAAAAVRSRNWRRSRRLAKEAMAALEGSEDISGAAREILIRAKTVQLSQEARIEARRQQLLEQADTQFEAPMPHTRDCAMIKALIGEGAVGALCTCGGTLSNEPTSGPAEVVESGGAEPSDPT